MRTQLSKSFLFLSLIVLLLSTVASLAANQVKSVSACVKASDCKLVDLGCGRPGAVNQEVSPPDSTEACDAAADFNQASKLFSVDCKNKKCELVQKDSKAKAAK